MYSVCICSWWWDVHICIYFVSSIVFVDFLIKSSFQKKTLNQHAIFHSSVIMYLIFLVQIVKVESAFKLIAIKMPIAIALLNLLASLLFAFTPCIY